jgi:hypothetical protein
MNQQVVPFKSEPRRLPGARDASDLRLLQALAAAHMLFGRHEEATSLLALAAWINPTDPRTQEISAIVEMRGGRSDLAEATAKKLMSAGHELGPMLKKALSRAEVRKASSSPR